MSTYTSQLTAEELKQAREWCAELSWRDVDSDYVMDEATDGEIARCIARTYAGGIAAFKRDGVAVEVAS